MKIRKNKVNPITYYNVMFSFNSCAALNPANKTWASVFQSLVTSSNVLDHITFKHSPFKTSCSAVELGKNQDVLVTAEFQGAYTW